MIHADPCVGVSYGKERGSLKRLRENLDMGGRRGKLKVNIELVWTWTYICPVSSNFIFLDVLERPFEPYTL